MNIFKFEIDLSRKKTEQTIVSDIEAIFANELGDSSKNQEYLKEELRHSGQNFKALFSENSPIAVNRRSSGKTKYFVAKMNSFPQKGHDVVCIYVKTEDDNIFKQFKWVCDDLEKYCKLKSIDVDKNVTELYLFLSENNDVLYPESSIKADISSKDIDAFTIVCLILEIAIAIFMAFALFYKYIDWFSAISIWVAVGIPLIMQIRDWKARKLIIENLSQTVKSETKETGSNTPSTTTTPQNINPNTSLQAPATPQQVSSPTPSGAPQVPATPAQGASSAIH